MKTLEINKISPDESSFLQIISNIDQTIKSLYFIGSLPQRRLLSVAIVGTRKPTPYGREITYDFSFRLAKKGIVIISGLALGTDGIAHQAALDAGGITIAVLPSSVDAIYPYSHRSLAQKIIRGGGAVISEYAPGHTIAYKNQFIERNRIVSGLSDGLLITEAAERSGTLATAGFALNQGKPVMAVPGNITSPMSAGCNKLIATGATPVTKLDDILDELGIAGDDPQTSLPLGDNPQEQKILQLIAGGLRDGELLQRTSGLSAAQFSQTLTMLELTGRIHALGANQWSIKK